MDILTFTEVIINNHTNTHVNVFVVKAIFLSKSWICDLYFYKLDWNIYDHVNNENKGRILPIVCKIILVKTFQVLFHTHFVCIIAVK